MTLRIQSPQIASSHDALLEPYEREGFLVHDFNFCPDLIEACAEVTRGFVGAATRVQDLWRQENCVRTLGAHPDVIALLSALYKRRAFPFQTLNFTKGTEQGVHSDTIFFNSEPAHFMCGVWVALEDMDLENGPLVYYAQSHKRPISTLRDITKSGHKDLYAFFEAEAKNYKKTLGLIKKGQAVIWSANVLHGGSPIRDIDRTRLSQVTHYYFEDCVYSTPILEDTQHGKALIRSPYDFSKRQFMFSKRAGKTIWPKPRHFISDVASLALRRTFKF